MRIVINDHGQRFVFKTICGGDRTTRIALRPVPAQPNKPVQQQQQQREREEVAA